jgi:hypothetical protein
MEQPWQYWSLVSTLYVLGGIGFAGVTLLPLRSWLILRRNTPLWSELGPGRVAYALLVLCSVLALVLSGASLVKVARCLLGLHCHANRSGGWFFLACIGAYYLAFEAFAYAVLRAARRISRVAA